MVRPTVVVAGAGQAGTQTAASLREFGFDGNIVLVGDEPHLPYQRPPLSKGHITGKAARDTLWLHPATFYDHHEIDRYIPDRVRTIERAAGRVELASGTTLGYDHLVLALGARNRTLPLDGADLDGVVGLRTLAEADDLRERLARARNVVVVGGGFIGLEVAAAAVALGLRTVVIEVADRLMGRVLSPPMADFLLDAHRARGLQVELGTTVERITGTSGRVTAVATADGRKFPADVVLVGIGALPNTELAEAAGLPIANGIVVDQFLRTADPRISAVGDCASCPNPFAGGRRIRLESVHNATAQPRALAARIVGRPEPYHSVPWFWSDQSDMKLQIAGLTTATSEFVFRGDPGSGRFSIFCFDDGRLQSVESLSRPGDHMAARKLLAIEDCLSPEQAADAEFDLRTHLSSLATAAKSH
ncbi:Rhodocoxin reductase [Nocardia cerradoensis]|uniref:Rhodocoxin reductase n=1 Tax=Nocardia cerradoensis TaxID=85688 RepID=A0A231HDE0_9NOCA|nr:FAD-dependent oxidoreductase [Nocardia cerradoensis]OXR46973.1 Rhodocoxin reductase [Nocardia cerradoensis]